MTSNEFGELRARVAELEAENARLLAQVKAADALLVALQLRHGMPLDLVLAAEHYRTLRRAAREKGGA